VRPALAGLALLAAPIACPAAAQDGGAAAAISKFRAQHGLGRVIHDAKLTRIAQDQANAMAAKNLLDHSALGSFHSRVAPAGAAYAAENIAYGYDDFPRTLDQWIHSSGHRANLLLKEGSRVGVAHARNAAAKRTYWAMVIGGGYESSKTKQPGQTEARSKSRSPEKKPPRSSPCRISLLGLCL
jgi:hypothetical protein